MAKYHRRLHVSTSIDGLLTLSDRNLEKLISASVRDDEGNIPTLSEFKKYLNEEKAKGHRLIKDPECDNFDPVKGCLGHEIKDGDQ